jgi:hypothetical protein
MPQNTIDSLKEQVRRNAVALISVFIAVSSLSYNTWRNELTEYNRNQRLVSIEVLLKLEELQELVFYIHYDQDTESKGNPRSGWAIVLTIRDLAQILEQPVPESAAALYSAWNSNWSGLGNPDDIGADAILESIQDFRDDTLALLQMLD